MIENTHAFSYEATEAALDFEMGDRVPLRARWGRPYEASSPTPHSYGKEECGRPLVVEQTCNDVSVVAGVFLARRGREVVPGYVEWAQRGEGRTGDHPKGAPTNAHLLCCRLSTYARYAFEATPRIWTLVDALTRHYKSVRPLGQVAYMRRTTQEILLFPAIQDVRGFQYLLAQVFQPSGCQAGRLLRIG